MDVCSACGTEKEWREDEVEIVQSLYCLPNEVETTPHTLCPHTHTIRLPILASRTHSDTLYDVTLALSPHPSEGGGGGVSLVSLDVLSGSGFGLTRAAKDAMMDGYPSPELPTSIMEALERIHDLGEDHVRLLLHAEGDEREVVGAQDPDPDDGVEWVMAVHFHHVSSRTKRKSVLASARSLDVAGFLVVGKPGCLVAKARRPALDAFWEQVRSLAWKRAVVKGYFLLGPDAERVSAWESGFVEVSLSASDVKRVLEDTLKLDPAVFKCLYV